MILMLTIVKKVAKQVVTFILLVICLVALQGCGTTKPDDRRMQRLSIPLLHKGHTVSNFPMIISGTLVNYTMDRLMLMEAMDSKRLSKVFQGGLFYRCFTTDARMNGPPGVNTFMILDDIPYYINSDEAAVEAISNQRVKIRNRSGAKNLLLSFSELRNYVVQATPPIPYQIVEDGQKLFWPANAWNLDVKEEANGWVLSCSFLCVKADSVEWYYRYVMRIERTGVIAILSRTNQFSVGGFL